MNIKLYNFSKRKNSTLQPSGGTEVNVVLKSNCSIYTPIFLLSTDNVENYNYLSWNNRYYYITDIVKTNIKDCWELSCNIDVLATYKSDILNTTAFVLYNTNQYNTMLADTRLSLDPVPSTLAYYEKAFEFTTGVGGGYVLKYITLNEDNIDFAPIGMAIVDTYGVRRVGATLLSDFMTEGWEEILKQLGAAKDALIDCKYFPVTGFYDGDGNYTSLLTYGSTMNVTLGKYTIPNLTGRKPTTRVISNTINVPIPRLFNDFRITSEYNKLLMFLPAYGFINLDSTVFSGQSTIPVKYYLDLLTGELAYIVGGDKGQRIVTCLYSDIPIGVNKTDTIGSLISGISAVANFATKNVGSGISDSFNAILKANSHDLGNAGTLNGVSSIIASLESHGGYIYLVSINNDVTIEPDDMLSKYGRPLNAVKYLGDLTGYCQTADASVSGNAPDNLKDEINNYLNGGVYIE